MTGRRETAPGSGTFTAVGDEEDELMALEFGVSYALGPGITTSLNVLYVDMAGANDEDADGTLGVVGLKYNF